MEINKIYNDDCFEVMKKMDNNFVDIILTSPPYNTSRTTKNSKNFQHLLDTHQTRYDIYTDTMTDEEYIEFTIKLFNEFDRIITKNGIVLYNLSYSSENTHLIWLVVADIIRNTNWIVADDIIWKKKSALPNNVSPNKLTRIVEHVFVFCRKDEFKTFNCNKPVKSIRKTGQKSYANIFNFIEAANNDGKNTLNKATYSTELCEKLLNIYAKDGNLIYDPFIGTGTTAIACVKNNLNFIGSELSPNQCEYAMEQLKNVYLKNNFL